MGRFSTSAQVGREDVDANHAHMGYTPTPTRPSRRVTPRTLWVTTQVHSRRAHTVPTHAVPYA